MQTMQTQVGEELRSEEMMEIYSSCYGDVSKFCKVFLPENFYQNFAPIHDDIIDRINEKKERKMLAICATRGIGKTSLARARAAHGILFADFNFVVYLGKSATHAEMQTENLKKDLMGPEIRKIFGDIKAKSVGGVEESWSKKTWVVGVGKGENRHFTLVLPRGAGQQIRGLLWKTPNGKSVRPDLIICDDMEDPDLIENELNRRKTKEWFFADVLKCFSRLDRHWEILYIDTLKHEDALMQLLLDASDWESTTVSICDEQYKSRAPEFMTDKEIEIEIQSHREKGIMDIFAREIMCMPISKEDAVFKQSYFRTYEETDTEFVQRKPNILNVVIVDPAKTASAHSAETGIVVWGIDLETSKMYLRFAEGRKLHSDQIVDEAINLCRRYQARVLGVETTGLGEFGSYPFQSELIKQNILADFEDLKAKKGEGEFAGVQGGKKMRIASLVHYYRRGMIYHNAVGTGGLELQLLGYPRSKRWDIMDAAAYITQMLERGCLYFLVSGVNDSDPETTEAEYAELNVAMASEPALKENWRIA